MPPTPPRWRTGPNLSRLRAIKTKFDPRNFFKHNVNIPPN